MAGKLSNYDIESTYHKYGTLSASERIAVQSDQHGSNCIFISTLLQLHLRSKPILAYHTILYYLTPAILHIMRHLPMVGSYLLLPIVSLQDA